MSSLIVCHACDLVHRGDAANFHTRLRCVRCRAELYRSSSASIDAAIALAISAAVLLLVSNAYPLVKLEMNGSSRSTTLLGAALSWSAQGYFPVAVLVLSTTVLVPLFHISGLLYVLIPLRNGRRAPGQNHMFRALARLKPWALPEVFMLGALVALVKLAAMADVIPGIALFCYGALMLTLSALTAITPTEQFWRWVDEGGQ